MNEYDLVKLFLKYHIDYENLKEITITNDINNLEEILRYLINEKKISPKNLAKSPSIFNTKSITIKDNFSFLEEVNLKKALSNCLHVLNTNNDKLKETYYYVLENYGPSYLEKITSILSVPVERIKLIELSFSDTLSKENILSAATSKFDIFDLTKIINTCINEKIKILPTVFLRNSDEIKALSTICHQKKVSLNTTMFHRSPDEVEQIINFCQEKSLAILGAYFLRKPDEVEEIINITKNISDKPLSLAFNRTPSEVKDIIKICQEEKTPLTSNMFLRTPGEVKKIIKLCQKENIPLTGSHFQQPYQDFEDILGYCQENNLNLTASMLFRKKDEISSIRSFCNEKNLPIYETMYKRTPSEVEEIFNYCSKNNLSITPNLFRKKPHETTTIITTCKNLKLPPSSVVFKRTPDEIIDITSIFLKYFKTLPIKNAFNQKPKEVEDIIKLCLSKNIAITGTLFQKKAPSIKDSIDYLEKNYGEKYLKPLIIIKDKNHLAKVFPLLDSLGVLDTVINSPSILTLTEEEIKDRVAFLDRINENIVVGETFNSLFGLSRKNYLLRVEKENNKEGALTL